MSLSSGYWAFMVCCILLPNLLTIPNFPQAAGCSVIFFTGDFGLTILKIYQPRQHISPWQVYPQSLGFLVLQSVYTKMHQCEFVNLPIIWILG
jgi:hypothetical protein